MQGKIAEEKAASQAAVEAEQTRAATKIAAIQRGKRDRARVRQLKETKAAFLAAEAAEQAAAATKIAAIHRGKQDRARVVQMRTTEAALQAAEATSNLSTLAADLSGMSVRDLRKKATEMGVDEDAIEDARDGMDPPGALIALIVEQQAKREPPNAIAVVEALEAELSAMTVGELRKRAAEMGVDGDAIEDARDGSDPADEIRALIVEKAKQELTPTARDEQAMWAALEALEAELTAMTVRELRARAAEVGVGSEAIEDARDGADPPGEIRALILAHPQISDHLGL